MLNLAQKAKAYIKKHSLLKAGDRVGAAVSGGADSVALLRLLLELRPELGLVLSVVHLNHKLRGADADADEQFVAELARIHNLELHCESKDVASYATTRHLSIEAAARDLRYEFFQRLLAARKMDRIATAHTLDDQAETVLLRVARGAGTRGLAGIYPQLSVPGSQFSVVRPLLGVRRKEVEAYLHALGQPWREDKSNLDLRHTRNRVRHGILPRLERNLNPSVREALAEAAEIARAEEEYWQAEVASVLPQVWNGNKLKSSPLSQLSLAMQRHVVRTAAESLGLRLEFAHVEEILAVAAVANKSAMLPAGWTVQRSPQGLTFQPPEKAGSANSDYEYILPIPGRVEVPEAGACFEAALVRSDGKAGYNPEHSFDPALLAKKLLVRSWRAGDRFWPAHTKSPKKIKELLQARHVTGPERKCWPVIVSGEEVIWLRGFPAPASLRAKDISGEAVLIREFPLQPVEG